MSVRQTKTRQTAKVFLVKIPYNNDHPAYKLFVQLVYQTHYKKILRHTILIKMFRDFKKIICDN